MNEDFIPFELALKLKEKGFNYKCYYCYKNSIIMSHCSEPLNHNGDAVTYSAPTISQVLKWLRDEKKIHIATGYSNVSKWRYIIIHLGENFVKEANVWEKGFESYEQAALAGIEYVLNNLI
jgi:hypothetical protein